MTKKEIIDYVLNTPHNINPALLGAMLEEFSKGEEKSMGNAVSINFVDENQPGKITANGFNMISAGAKDDFLDAVIMVYKYSKSYKEYTPMIVEDIYVSTSFIRITVRTEVDRDYGKTYALFIRPDDTVEVSEGTGE